MSFSEFLLSPEILRSVRDRGHHHATPIQFGAIPAALSGRDLIATAETGSGKTAAYLLPLIDRLHRKRDSGRNGAGASAIRALILAPTRELAAQVAREFSVFARNTGLRAAVIVGGDSMNGQLHDLRAGAQVAVACPGRLIDHMERGTIKLDRVELLVVDEADRLMDMGFLPQLRRIVRMVPRRRQTLMFSATMGPEVVQIAREFLDNPAHVNVGEKSTPPAAIRQTVYPVTLDDKGPMLLELLRRSQVESAIVFTRTRIRADRVARLLARNGVNAIAIHGDRSQSQRNAALGGFRAGKYRVMVATDVAARGLDIDDVSHVINFDLPVDVESYVHRIGRTGRAGADGVALSFCDVSERDTLRAIQRLTNQTLAVEAAPKGLPPVPVATARPASATPQSASVPRRSSHWQKSKRPVKNRRSAYAGK